MLGIRSFYRGLYFILRPTGTKGKTGEDLDIFSGSVRIKSYLPPRYAN